MSKILIILGLLVGLAGCVYPSNFTDDQLDNTSRSNLIRSCLAYSAAVNVILLAQDTVSDETWETLTLMNAITDPICLDVDKVESFDDALEEVNKSLIQLREASLNEGR